MVPYFGYARQDRKDEGRVPITAKLVANLITTAGADRVLTMDLHAAQVQGFFDIPVDNLYAEPVFSRYWSGRKLTDLVLVSPDVGNTKRARAYAERLGGSLAIIDKRRVSGQDVESGHDHRQRAGQDRADDGRHDHHGRDGHRAARLCKDNGATAVYVGATHAVLCGPAIERLREAPIDELVVTDTIPIGQEKINALRQAPRAVGGRADRRGHSPDP